MAACVGAVLLSGNDAGAQSTPPCKDAETCVDEGERVADVDKAGARARFRRACDLGHADGCALLASRVKASAALALFRKACDSGSGAGCAGLAKAYRSGVSGAARDRARAAKLFKQARALDDKACRATNARACTRLGFQLRDEKKAQRAFATGCDLGSATACGFARIKAARGSAARRRFDARHLRLLRQQCAATPPHATACTRVAEILSESNKNTTAERTRLNKRACRAGLARGCSGLGGLMLHGKTPDWRKAVRHFQTACKMGDRSACEAAGLIYGQGRLGQPDFTRARRLFATSCKNAEASCTRYAHMLEHGLGGRADNAAARTIRARLCAANPWDCRLARPAAARAFYESRCARAGDHCEELADMYANAEGGPRETAKARALYERLCRSTGRQCEPLAKMMLEGIGGPKRPKKLQSLVRAACKPGRGACAVLAMLYGTGRGGTKAPSKSLALFEKSCKRPTDRGCFLFAIALRAGFVTKPDNARANKLLVGACSPPAASHDPLADACLLLATLQPPRSFARKQLAARACFEGGPTECAQARTIVAATSTPKPEPLEPRKRPDKPPIASISADKTACKSGDAAACSRLRLVYRNLCDRGKMAGCHDLAMAHQRGLGVPRRYDKAYALYTQACGAGFMLSCNNLGFLYENARGVPRSYAKARQLYAKACRAGEKLACHNLNELTARRVQPTRTTTRRTLQPPSPSPRRTAPPRARKRVAARTRTARPRVRRTLRVRAPKLAFTHTGFSVGWLEDLRVMAAYAEHTRYRKNRRVYGARVRAGQAQTAGDDPETGFALGLDASVGHVFKHSDIKPYDDVRRVWTWTAGGEATLLYNTVADDYAPGTMIGGLGFVELAGHSRFGGHGDKRSRLRLRLRGGFITEAGAGLDAMLGFSRGRLGFDIAGGSFGGTAGGTVRLYLAFE